MSKPTVDTKGNIHVDDAFLQAYVEKGGQVQTTQGTPVDNADALLNEVGKDEKSATRKADALHKEVEKKQESDQKAIEKADKQAQVDAKKAEEAAKRLNRTRISQAEKVVNAVKKASDPVLKKVGHATDRFGRARTVGGIGLLLAILIFLLFIVVEVNNHGDTRIKQLWYMLLGRAALIGRRTITPNATPKADNSNSLQNELGSAALSTVDPTGVLSTINSISQSFRPRDALGF